MQLSIEVLDFQYHVFFTTYINTKVKCNIIEYGCADTIVAVIGNGFVRVSQTKHKVNLVGFDNDISMKYILVGDAVTDINLANVDIITHMNVIPLPHEVLNSLLSTSQYHKFDVDIYYFTNLHGDKQ